MPAPLRPLVSIVALAALVFALGACQTVRDAVAGEPAVAPSVWSGKTFFTQHGLRHENNRWRTTNYQVGILVPVNTEVEVRSMDARRATLYVRPSGPELLVENVEKHTAKSMADAFADLCGERPVDLSGFTADERRFVAEGRVEPGMRKEAVLAAIGPPPAIGTPTLDSHEWKYWRTRFTTFLLRFEDGVLAEQIGR
ncbi:MAG: hypothetical protein ACF8XB_03775 [Planctomycetota bacterium JB042]